MLMSTLSDNYVYITGMWVTYDLSREPNNRVVEVLIRCTECNIPEYLPLEEWKLYKIVMPSFIADGGDGYDVIAEHGKNRQSGNVYWQYAYIRVSMELHCVKSCSRFAFSVAIYNLYQCTLVTLVVRISYVQKNFQAFLWLRLRAFAT